MSYRKGDAKRGPGVYSRDTFDPIFIPYYNLQPLPRHIFSGAAAPRRRTLSQLDTYCLSAMTKIAGWLEMRGLARGHCKLFRIVLA